MTITKEQLIHCIMEAEIIIDYCVPRAVYGNPFSFSEHSASVVDAAKLIEELRKL